jgi:hypothetical protein
VDWLCLPRLDAGSYFGRLLDRERGGWCAITPADPVGLRPRPGDYESFPTVQR